MTLSSHLTKKLGQTVYDQSCFSLQNQLCLQTLANGHLIIMRAVAKARDTRANIHGRQSQ